MMDEAMSILTLLLVDDNISDMRHFVDEFILEGHNVYHAYNYNTIQKAIASNKDFHGIILDLMFTPEDGIPALQTDLGYTAGIYIYENLIRHKYPNVPFVILSATDKTTDLYLSAIERLNRYPSFRGFCEKPIEIKELLEYMLSHENE